MATPAVIPNKTVVQKVDLKPQGNTLAVTVNDANPFTKRGGPAIARPQKDAWGASYLDNESYLSSDYQSEGRNTMARVLSSTLDGMSGLGEMSAGEFAQRMDPGYVNQEIAKWDGWTTKTGVRARWKNDWSIMSEAQRQAFAAKFPEFAQKVVTESGQGLLSDAQKAGQKASEAGLDKKAGELIKAQMDKRSGDGGIALPGGVTIPGMDFSLTRTEDKPWYKNPWVIGGGVAAVALLAFLLLKKKGGAAAPAAG